MLYHQQGQYSEAEPLFERALAIREKILPSDAQDLRISLLNLTEVYYSLGKHSEAELLSQRWEYLSRSRK